MQHLNWWRDLLNIGTLTYINFNSTYPASLVAMSANVQYRIALELDFPEKIVRRALQKYKFKDAGTFVDYLEMHMDEFEAEGEEEEEVNSEEKNITLVTPPDVKEDEKGAVADSSTITTKQLSLKEETELLYRQSRCLACCDNRRSFVTLPCSHFTLCASCEPKARQCPLSDCREEIECTIQTYGF